MSPPLSQISGVRILDDGAAVALSWDDGSTSRFHAIWLRDNAQDPSTRSPQNGQRLITVLDIDVDVRVTDARVDDDGALAVRFGPEELSTEFAAAWLHANAYDVSAHHVHGWTADDVVLWDGTLQDSVPTANHVDLLSGGEPLVRWLRNVERYGFAVITGCPTESGALLTVAEMFGFVRETNYGKMFEVRAEVNPNNLAYTNLGLQAHTDNPYRDPVPTLQILACLENTVEGGHSMVVDGFEVALRLKQENPRWFELLSGYPARFSYAANTEIALAAKRPMIELGPDGELIGIRFNNRSAAPFVDVPYDDVPDYYAAYRRFAELVEDPALAVSFKLAPGELFIVNNTRVLHARTAFSSGGNRWLQGCYADIDGLRSTRRALEAQTARQTAGEEAHG